ncbi:MAG: hypothetical protein AAGH15_22540 [Myxococcota bacterium]
MRRLLLTALVLTGVVGCGDDVDPVSLVTRPRILGFDLSVEGDPERTTPAPGETLTITVPFAFPEESLDVDFQGIACFGVDVGFGIPFCAGDESDPTGGIFALLADRSTAPAFPVVSFPIPPEAADGTTVLVIAATCAGGVVDPELLSSALDPTQPLDGSLEVCAGGVGTGELVQSRIPVQLEEDDTNTRPLSLVQVELDGQLMGPDPGAVPGTPCAEMAELVTLRVDGDAVDLIVEGAPETFEDFFREGADDQPIATVEDMQVALLITSGEVQANFLFLERDDVVEDTEYTPATSEERTLDLSGSLERLWFSVRDERGGLAVESRAFCLLPPAPI